MESALQARSSGTIDPLCFEKAHATLYHVDAPVLPSSSLCSITTSAALRQTEAMPQDPSPSSAVTEETQEEECLVDSQPICFKENPFLVANRKGKGRPLEERILSGPPTGYGRQGHLQTLLYNKVPSADPPRIDSPVREPLYSPGSQLPSLRQSSCSAPATQGRETRYASIHVSSNVTTKDSSATKPGAIQPISRVRPPASPVSQDGHRSPNPFQHGPSPVNSQTTPRAPSPDTFNEFPINVKQAYKAFAAVPHSMAVLEPPQDLYSQRNNFHPKQTFPEPHTSCGRGSPEQRSFRDRQKYFEIDVKQQTPDSKPKPRVSLVGEDDLKKMKEEEAKRIESAREYIMDEDEDDEEEDLAKQVAQMKAHGKVILDGVEYKVESVSGHAPTPPRQCATPSNHSATPPSSGPSSVDGRADSQRNSMEDSFRLEPRPNSMTGLIPVYPGESAAPVRTAKAERRHQERLRVQSPELSVVTDKDLSPAEKRALEAEKRAMWRAARPYGLEEDVRQYEQDLAKRLYQSRVRASLDSAAAPSSTCSSSSQPRMKSLEQDALKAQMVIAKSKEGRKRGTLDQLAESPSPAPTPSPTPMEDYSPRSVTSPGRLSLSEKKFDYRQFAAIPSAKPVYDIQSPDATDVQFNSDVSTSPGSFLG